MEYHEIGKTGMKVSSLSFGASSLGGVFHDIKEKEGIPAAPPAPAPRPPPPPPPPPPHRKKPVKGASAKLTTPPMLCF